MEIIKRSIEGTDDIDDEDYRGDENNA